MKHFNLRLLQSSVPSTLSGPNIPLLIRLLLYAHRLSQFRIIHLPYIQVCADCVEMCDNCSLEFGKYTQNFTV